MKLFVSYARVDKPYCQQIVERLNNVHEVWYDRRLHAGQAWWDEIVRQLHWCEGFVYLLSPESFESEYCQREFKIAQKQGKHLFPVMIRKAKGGKILIPVDLNHIHYADLTESMEQISILMDALTVAERSLRIQPLPQPVRIIDHIEQPGAGINSGSAIGQAADAMDSGDFDKAVFILKQAQEKTQDGRNARLIARMLEEAETMLERQAYLREAEREYAPIAELAKRAHTRPIGCEEFQEFRKEFPDYDPENLSEICQSVIHAEITSGDVYSWENMSPPDVSAALPPPFEWCYVPQGVVTLEDASEYGGTAGGQYEVSAFYIAKYPITNAQYEVFAEAKDGYSQARWWDYSNEALAWRGKNLAPRKITSEESDVPRTNVTWYEAVAFCRWLNAQFPILVSSQQLGWESGKGMQIRLPTDQEWQRAA